MGVRRAGDPRRRASGVARDPDAVTSGRSSARPPTPEPPPGSLGRLGRQTEERSPAPGPPFYLIQTLAGENLPGRGRGAQPGFHSRGGEGVADPRSRLAGQVSEPEGTGDPGGALAGEGRSLCMEPRPALN